MLNVTFITVGTLKEDFLRAAFAEYEKRLRAFCKFELVNVREEKLSENPSESEIAAALEAEGKQILAAFPSRAYKIAMCVEGKELSSEEFAEKLERIGASHGAVALVVGSSYGLSPTVKSACDFRQSISKLTFPHQLMRVILAETLYRSLGILHGTKYHK
ncbi:MAG: 23S rRNA (pseudouridine(1915)-N(3))-methyltransferase RlmH [Ruminococcaceae bacterium]|nr:23S rRNA (pseudouridine(1915)-N(3))-methyltransferase RlmH [Oscillospiraceae bacterium]